MKLIFALKSAVIYPLQFHVLTLKLRCNIQGADRGTLRFYAFLAQFT